MKLLLKQATILDTNSPFNGLLKDILITDGIIERVEDSIPATGVKVIEADNLLVSKGWVDIFSHFNDPGFEHKETLATGANAAASGGFTHVFVLPDTLPAAANKTAIEYIVQKSKSLPVNILPIGAVTKNIEGKELSEMYDMHNSGAIAFSDGLQPVQIPGLLLKALQYIKAIDAVLIQLPVDKSISKFGLMNEGTTSTRLGLAGIPSVAEELMVTRDIELAKYTGSKLHITGISTAKSLQIVKKAKEDGVSVTCSVTPFHLVFCDEDLFDYDTNLKTDPPLRSRDDMNALRRGIENGVIDCIASHHLPQNWDNKICEFEYAATGMIGLETAFSVVNNIFPDITSERMTDLFGNNARNIFLLPQNTIKENEAADITIFTREGEFIYKENAIKSKSKNTPFINKPLTGKVIGIIYKDRVYLNE